MPVQPWINEFHYDNSGTDTGEFIEIAGLSGTDLGGWAIVLYSGSTGFAYSVEELTGVIPDQSNGVGTLSFAYPANGIAIQNGPDGIALYDSFGTLVQFISYEGSFNATDFFSGNTISSTNIGVAETGAAAAGGSLALNGPPSTGTWQVVSDDTPGSLNAGQVFAPAPKADFVNLQFPSSASSITGGSSGFIYGRIYETGLTEAPGSASNVIAQLGYGPAGSDPTVSSEWIWVDAAFNVQVGNDDEYMASLTVPEAGSYAYTFRFGIDDGIHPVEFTYADLDGAGTNGGLSFDANKLGALTVDWEIINGTSSPETINGDSNSEIINGLGGDDTINGGGGHDRIFGGDGNDSIFGGAETIWMEGGAGNDFLSGYGTVSYQNASGAVQVSLKTGTSTGADGNDTISAATHVVGSSFDDTLTGSDDWSVADVLEGGGGNDLLDGGEGSNELHGDGGIDTVTYANSAGSVFVSVSEGGTALTMTGFDTLFGIENAIGSAFDDNIDGDAGNNALTGLAGNDTLSGNDGNDTLDGGGGNDTLSGGVGDDTLKGGAGDDSIDGGTGNDTASYADATAGVTVSLAVAGAQNTLGAGVDTLTGIENLIGSAYADQLTGSVAANLLTGLGGNDVIAGGSGADTLDGGAGNDTLDGAIGADELIGGGGNDTLLGGAGSGNDILRGGAGDDAMTGGQGSDIYYVDSLGDTTVEAAGEGQDLVSSSISWTLSANTENLTLTGTAATGIGNDLVNTIIGNNANNSLSGLGSNDTLNGGGGNDSLDGGGANDTLSGGDGSDTLLGGEGTDTLNGGTGNDVLEGGTERDIMTGGTGADQFVFRSGDTGNTQSSADKITDFSAADGDKIDLSFVDANTTVANDQAFSFIGTAAFSNVAGQLRYAQTATDTFIYGDTNGDGVADLMIRLAGTHSLNSGDFVP